MRIKLDRLLFLLGVSLLVLGWASAWRWSP
jgi:hypothetical protein